MDTKPNQATFQAIESFLIKRKNEMYVIGEIIEGTFEKNWLLRVPLNASIDLALRIIEIEEIELFGDRKVYTLLVISTKSTDPDDADLLFSMAGVGNERLRISIEGVD